MIQTDDDTFVAGMAEVRDNLPEFVMKVQGGKVIITKRGTPVAVLRSYEYDKALDDELGKISDEKLL